jgi:anaerobic ribonucleoside-triphosphate reductase
MVKQRRLEMERTNNTQTRKKKVVGVPTEVYSRIVGYYRPVQNWNEGKKKEFSERRPLKYSL